MRRRKLTGITLDLYPMMSQAEKERHQERVFLYYYDRNGEDLDLTIDELNADLVELEKHERYERCQILKDILDRFE